MNSQPVSRCIQVALALLLCTSLLASPNFSHPAAATRLPAGSELAPAAQPMFNEQPPSADAGLDFTVPPGYPARFFGSGAIPVEQPLTFTWDFDGDSQPDYAAQFSTQVTHTYTAPGVYLATLAVSDPQGQTAYDSLLVTVDPAASEQTYTSSAPLRIEAAALARPANEAVSQYALLLNGSGETRFWDDVTFMYDTLINDYGFSAETIVLLNNTGVDPWGGNPDGMIDYPATIASLETAFSSLAGQIDGDDHLFIWVTDHGSGYLGRQSPSFGHLSTNASVDPGDEEDYLEQDFVLQAMHMNRFFTYYTYYAQSNTYTYTRVKHVPTFTDLYFEELGYRTDQDVMLERLTDYLLGDFNRDATLDPSLGEIMDFDGDGIMPYDPVTGAFDEDDWGPLDTYEDPQYGVSWMSTHVPGGPPYALFDAGLDGTLDIDLNYRGGAPVIDGTDLDGDARFDFLDVNEDGDLDDWVSIDEELSLAGWGISDDDFAALVDLVGAGQVSVFMLPCFSGGFIDDLSAPNRVISTAAGEESYSYGNLFADLFTGAFHRFSRYGVPLDADSDRNGEISMLEAFNFAARNDYYSETPMYDDNGDREGHFYPIPNGGEGDFGATVYLRLPSGASQLSIDIQPKSPLNKIDRRSRAALPVAILSYPGFSAPSQVQAATLTFGRTGFEDSLLWKEPQHLPVCAPFEVNGDGLPDLVCSFAIPKTGFVCGDTQGHLHGLTTSGASLTGSDLVWIIPCP